MGAMNGFQRLFFFFAKQTRLNAMSAFLPSIAASTKFDKSLAAYAYCIEHNTTMTTAWRQVQERSGARELRGRDCKLWWSAKRLALCITAITWQLSRTAKRSSST